MDVDRDLATARMVLARLEAACRAAEIEVTRTREAGEAIGRVIVALETGGGVVEDPAPESGGATADAAPASETQSEAALRQLPAS